jgi:hypothetical protein
MHQSATAAPEGTVQAPAGGWSMPDLPEAPGTVLQYLALNGDRVVAVLADTCMWRIQSINGHGVVHAWSWTPAALAGNLWGVDSFQVVAAPQ